MNRAHLNVPLRLLWLLLLGGEDCIVVEQISRKDAEKKSYIFKCIQIYTKPYIVVTHTYVSIYYHLYFDL